VFTLSQPQQIQSRLEITETSTGLVVTGFRLRFWIDAATSGNPCMALISSLNLATTAGGVVGGAKISYQLSGTSTL
jgi:hypothetical protein